VSLLKYVEKEGGTEQSRCLWRNPFRGGLAAATPAQFPNRLEFVNAEGTSFVAGSGTGRRKSGKDGFTFGLVNFGGVEALI
jgi:hypothetical protein